MSERISDNEWAAGVMGWVHTVEVQRGWNIAKDAGHGTFRPLTAWNPDTDANDFRSLLNCEAVREWFRTHSCPFTRDELLADALLRDEDDEVLPPDQPDGLRRLREAMEGEARQ